MRVEPLLLRMYSHRRQACSRRCLSVVEPATSQLAGPGLRIQRHQCHCLTSQDWSVTPCLPTPGGWELLCHRLRTCGTCVNFSAGTRKAARPPTQLSPWGQSVDRMGGVSVSGEWHAIHVNPPCSGSNQAAAAQSLLRGERHGVAEYSSTQSSFGPSTARLGQLAR